MAEAYGSIVGMKDDLEDDGSLMLQVADFGGEPFEVWVRSDVVRELLSRLQQAQLRQIEGTGGQATYLQANIQKVQIAYQGATAALLVSTDQLGSLALSADEQMLGALGAEIEKAREYLSRRRH
jgi:hypothetical protein